MSPWTPAPETEPLARPLLTGLRARLKQDYAVLVHDVEVKIVADEGGDEVRVTRGDSHVRYIVPIDVLVIVTERQ